MPFYCYKAPIAGYENSQQTLQNQSRHTQRYHFAVKLNGFDLERMFKNERTKNITQHLKLKEKTNTTMLEMRTLFFLNQHIRKKNTRKYPPFLLPR